MGPVQCEMGGSHGLRPRRPNPLTRTDSPKAGVRSFVTWEEHKVELPLVYIEMCQLRQLRHLFRTPPGCFPGEMFSLLEGQRFCAAPGTQADIYILIYNRLF